MRLIFIIIFYCFIVNAFGQNKTILPLRFQHLDEKNGLSNNEVNAIFKDSRGFIWIGTTNGLNRFDGSTFGWFRHSAIDTFSISGNAIFSIAEDNHHQIWVSSQCTGLSVLNPFNGKAFNYPAAKFLNDACDFHVLSDEKKNVWTISRTKLSVLKTDSRTFDEYPLFSQKESNQAYSFAIDKNSIWIGHGNGLKQFDRVNKKFTTHDDWVGHSLCGVIKIERDGNLLIGTWQRGLFIVDPRTGRKKEVLKGSIVNDVAEVSFYGHDQLWVATDNGLYTAELPSTIFALTDASFTHYTNDKINASSLSDKEVKCIWDDHGTIWLGTGKGIDIFNPSYLQFSSSMPLRNHRPFATTYLNYALAEKDENGNILYDLCYWHGSGLLQTDSSFNIKKQLIIKDKQQKPLIISSCIRGKDGYLWLATWDGLWCYDDKNKKLIKSYKKETPGNLHLSTNSTDFVLQDTKERFWIGTYEHGLNMLDIKNHKATVFFADGKKGSVTSNRCDFIFQDSKGNIWITGPALQKYNEATHDFITYATVKGNASSLPGLVNSIIEDHNHHLWLATNGGVSEFDATTALFHTYTTEDGLASDECNSIVEDDKDNIWVTTNGGLSCINSNSGSIITYTTIDWLPTNQLGAVIMKDPKGSILFSLDGFNSPFVSFNADNQIQQQSPSFHFTTVNILGTDQPFGEPLEAVDALHLSYKQNVFTVSFKVLDYTNPNNIRYQCQLLGFNKSWINLGHYNHVTYTNLDGGTYALLVRATDAKGQWLNKELQLKIIITPPFWKTWWFYMASVALLIAVIYTLFRIRFNKMRKEGEQKAAIAKEMSELEMKALKAQMNPHFIFNALSSIQESIVNGNTEAASRYLGKFSKLIRTVLEFSDKKLITLQEEIKYLTLYLELESFRYDDFHFTISIDEKIDKEFVRLPPMLVQPFIENAIKHGLRHKSGEKNLSVIFEEFDNSVIKVTIDDDGIGREQAAVLNLSRNLSARSMGINITSRRLQFINKNETPLMNVTDKRKSTGEANGTNVTLFIPLDITI